MIKKLILMLIILIGVASPIFCIDTAYADDECYALRNVCLNYNSVDYNSAGNAFWFNGSSLEQMGVDVDLSNIDGINDVSLYLINASPNYETIYFMNGSSSALNMSLDDIYGEGNWSVDFSLDDYLIAWDKDYYYNYLGAADTSLIGASVSACLLTCEKEVSSPLILYSDRINVENLVVSVGWSSRGNEDPSPEENCSLYNSLFDDYSMSISTPYTYISNELELDSGYRYYVSESAFIFNSSTIPEGVVVTSAHLYIPPYTNNMNPIPPENDIIIIVSGVQDGIFPFAYDPGNGIPWNASVHSMPYGSFNLSEALALMDPITLNAWDPRDYVNVELNNYAIDAINSGNFSFSLRTQDYIDMKCPDVNNSVNLLVWSDVFPIGDDSAFSYPRISLTVEYETSGPTPTPTLIPTLTPAPSNGAVEDLTNIIPIIFAAILITVLIVSMAMGFSIGMVFYIALLAIIGLSLLGVISSIVNSI